MTLDKFALWLEREETNASEYHRGNKIANDTERAAYWEGYADAMTNAAATYYGPTPLDSLASVENEYTRGIKDALDDLSDAYPEIRNSELWAEFMESGAN